MTKAIAIRWDTSRLVTPGLSDEWKVEVPEREEEEPTKLKNVVLPPKTDFFDGLTGMAVDRSGRRGVVTYKTGGPGAKPATRVEGRSVQPGNGEGGTPATTEGEYVPLALHYDGQRIVVQARERGFGNSGRMEVWSLQGSRVAKHLECNPFVDAKGSARDLAWARFVDENRLQSAAKGAGPDSRFPRFDPAVLCRHHQQRGTRPSAPIANGWRSATGTASACSTSIPGRSSPSGRRPPSWVDLDWRSAPRASASPV